MARAHGWPTDLESIEDRLIKRGLMTASRVSSIAGALLLTDPAESLGLTKMHIDIRRYPDDSINYDRRVPITGSLPRQIAQATRFVMDEFGTDMVVSGVNRHEVPKPPEVVIREVMANAVAHRSYEIDRVSINVDLRPGRIEITSPGRLPEPVTLETLRFAQSARNPVVVDTLRQLHLAENPSRGIDVIQDSMAAALLDRGSATVAAFCRVVLRDWRGIFLRRSPWTASWCSWTTRMFTVGRAGSSSRTEPIPPKATSLR